MSDCDAQWSRTFILLLIFVVVDLNVFRDALKCIRVVLLDAAAGRRIRRLQRVTAGAISRLSSLLLALEHLLDGGVALQIHTRGQRHVVRARVLRG